MDSMDSCCGLKKSDSLQNAQADSNPKKVDLIIWEIEVPKVRAVAFPQAASSSKFPCLGAVRLGWGGVCEPEGTPSKPGRKEVPCFFLPSAEANYR
jgi:hypothetical protein